MICTKMQNTDPTENENNKGIDKNNYDWRKFSHKIIYKYTLFKLKCSKVFFQLTFEPLPQARTLIKK